MLNDLHKHSRSLLLQLLLCAWAHYKTKYEGNPFHISPFILAGMDAEGLFLIDNNSLPDAATATKCEDVLDVEPMRRELLQELPDLQLLHEALKSVWMQTTRAC